MSRTVWGRYRLGEVIFAELEARRRELERRQREMARQAKAAEYRKKLHEGIEAASQRLAAWVKVKQKLIAGDLLRLIDTETIEERVGSLKLSLSRCSSLKELAAVRSQIKRLEQDWSGLPERARVGKKQKEPDWQEIGEAAALESDRLEAEITTGECDGMRRKAGQLGDDYSGFGKVLRLG